MMQKSSLSNFCLTNVRNLKVFLEVHGRDIDFAKSEQSLHLTSTDAEAAAVRLLLPLHRKRYIPESYSIVCICEMALNPYLIRCLIPDDDTDMLFLLLKNAKDSSLAESSCLTLALATHTKKIKSFDGKRGGSHEMLISDVCHNYQFSKVILINVTHITP